MKRSVCLIITALLLVSGSAFSQSVFVPTPSTISILQPSPLPSGAGAPSTDPFDMAAAKAWVALQAQAVAYQLNGNMRANYLNFAFPNFLLNYEKTGDWTMTPPQPPNGMLVQLDSNNPFQPQILQIGPPVATVPAYTHIQPPPAPGTLAIGVHLTGNYWQVLPNDTMPGGYTTPAPVTTADGTTGLFTKIVYPFGGWWLKVN
jgi:hypothetical protein